MARAQAHDPSRAAPAPAAAGPQLLIDWVTEHGTIDPDQFASVDWRLVSGGQPITVS